MLDHRKNIIDFSLILTAFFVLLSSCVDITQPDEENTNQSLIYQNSFESEADTSGFWCWGMIEFRNEAPAGGGERSLFVTGGCPVPHVRFNLEPLEEEGKVLLICWGKALNHGGAVSLSIGNVISPAIGIAVTDSVWTAYQAEDTLKVAKGDTLTVQLYSGGIVPASMLVDNLKIYRLNSE